MRFRSFQITRRLLRARRAVLLVTAVTVLVYCAKESPNDPNVTRPKAVRDLAVAATTDSAATLSFTEVDDGLGNTASYDIRLSSSTMSWTSATRVVKGTCAAPVIGVSVNAKHLCTVLELLPSTGYTFQVAAFRGTLSQQAAVGPLSNVASASTAAAVAAVAVSPPAWSGTPGQTTQLTAAVKDANGNALTGRTVTWSSSNNAVAGVSSSGLVTNVGIGTANISATAESQSGQAQITVSAASSAPSTVGDLTSSSATDTSATLSFTEVDDGTGRPANYDIRVAVAPISWSAATGVTRGTCTTPMSGSSIGARRTCTVFGLSPSTSYNFQLVAFRGALGTSGAVFGSLSNVAAATTMASTVSVATVSVSPSTVNGTVGQTAQLTAATRDASGNVLTGRVVTWSSSDNTIASVSSTGLVSEAGAGTATITATSEGKTGQAQITVTAAAPVPVATVIISPASTSVPIGSTVQLTATTKDATGQTLTGRVITWSSADINLATVNGTGLVAGVAAGTVAVTATSEGKSTPAQITVTAPLPPPPPGNGEPVDPGANYLWSDDFDRYTSIISMTSTGSCPSGTAGFGVPSNEATYGRRTMPNAANLTQACDLVYDQGGNSRYQLIPGRSGAGQALRGTVATTTTSQAIDWLSPWGNSSSLAHDVTKSLVVQYYFRVSPGGLPGSVGMKWFELWIDELGGRPVQRLQWSTNGGATTQWRVTDGPNTMSGPGRALQSISPRLSDVNDGSWHRATFLFKANSTTTYQHLSGSTSATEVYSGTSSRDGRMAMWVDGIKIIDIQQSNVNVLVPGSGGALWCYQSDVDWIPHVKGQYLMWPSTINSPMPNPPWTLDLDDLKVWQF